MNEDTRETPEWQRRKWIEQAGNPVRFLDRDPDLQEHKLEVAREAWDMYRSYSPADLQVLHEHAKEKERAAKSYAGHYRKRGEDEKLARAERMVADFHTRAFVLQALIGLHLEKGQEDIPPFEKARRDVSYERYRSVPRKTMDCLAIASQFVDHVDSVDRLCHEVANDQDRSHGWAYKWLCSENPLYEPMGTPEARLDAMRDMIHDFITLHKKL